MKMKTFIKLLYLFIQSIEIHDRKSLLAVGVYRKPSLKVLSISKISLLKDEQVLLIQLVYLSLAIDKSNRSDLWFTLRRKKSL